MVALEMFIGGVRVSCHTWSIILYCKPKRDCEQVGIPTVGIWPKSVGLCSLALTLATLLAACGCRLLALGVCFTEDPQLLEGVTVMY